MNLRERAEQVAAETGTELLTDENGRAVRDIGAGEEGTFVLAAAPPPALPDVDLSGVPAELDVPVHVAWRRMMLDVQWLGKERQSRDYKYRGIDDVMNLVGPAERKHGVFVMPTGVEPVFEVINTKSGSPMNYGRIVCHFTIYGPRGDTMPASVLGEGFDTGDKSGTKAQSVALRTLYLNALAIQTNEPARDTEYGVQHEIAGPRVPTAEEYAAEILDDNTSINRLRQIKAELAGNPRMDHTAVEVLGEDQPIELGRLVRRVGAARLSKEG